MPTVRPPACRRTRGIEARSNPERLHRFRCEELLGVSSLFDTLFVCSAKRRERRAIGARNHVRLFFERLLGKKIRAHPPPAQTRSPTQPRHLGR